MSIRDTVLAATLLLSIACGGDSTIGSKVVGGSGLNLEDVSEDGTLVAYTDADNTLFVADIDSGDEEEVASGVDRARFEGATLTIFEGVDDVENTADVMLTWQPGGSATETGTLVVPSTVRGKGDHLYYEERAAPGSGTKNLFLDGTMIVAGAGAERARFSPDGSWLVVGSDTAMSRVESFPTSGGAGVTLAADGASNRFQITDDSRDVIIAVNETGDIADLAQIPIGGGSTEIIVDEGSDNGFSLFEGGATLAFLSPDDPQAPTTFALEQIEIDGSGRSELVASGVVDVQSTSGDGVVYATAVDAETSIATLHFVSSGTAARELGSQALDEGFSPDGSSYIFFDEVTLGGGDPGRLQLYRPSDDSLTLLESNIVRSSFLSASALVFRSDDDELFTADLGSGDVTRLSGGVDDYEKVPDSVGGESSRILICVGGGDSPGLFLVEP